MTFYRPVKANVANQFGKHDENNVHAHFGLSKIVVIYVIDDITV